MIRKTTIYDIPSIVKLEEKIFHHTLGATFLLDELESNPFAHYVCYELNSSVIGYIGLRLIDDTIEIMNFLIDEDYRGEGYGKALMDYVFDLAKKEHVKTIVLEVRKSNQKAQSFYTHFGFKKSHIRKNYYENEDAYVYVKEV